MPVHVSPCFRVADGDTVIFGQCRCVSTVFNSFISSVDVVHLSRSARHNALLETYTQTCTIIWSVRFELGQLRQGCKVPLPSMACAYFANLMAGRPPCRPLSKTVRFNVLRVIPAGALQKKAFATF